MVAPFTRRRVIAITAAAAGLELVPPHRFALAHDRPALWRGVILGAPASLQIHHPDPAGAQRLIDLAATEARRLERIFSLYQPDSTLAELNRRGVLLAPPAELVDLLLQCRRHHELTAGLFDPTVQPLWQLYTRHFSEVGPNGDGPPQAAIDAALANVGLANVIVDRDRIAFRRRGMGLTLNGIAQGYITDRVVGLLRRHGIAHSLVDMGEIRAIGARPEGMPWTVDIAGTAESVSIVDRAVATSAGDGYRFDSAGRFNHIFSPSTGRSPDPARSVTVVTDMATDADALSTAFSLMTEAAARDFMRRCPIGEARFAALATPLRENHL